MLPTRYPDPNFMETLGLEASVRHLYNQLEWEEYAKAMHVTYNNLTLEFLSSLSYEPYMESIFREAILTSESLELSTLSIIRSLLSYLVFSMALMICLKSLKASLCRMR